MLQALAAGAVVAAVAATLLTGRFFEMDGAMQALGLVPALLTGTAVASAMRASAVTIPGKVLWPTAFLLSAGSLSLGLMASVASGRANPSTGPVSTPVVFALMLAAAFLGTYVGRSITLQARRFFRKWDTGQDMALPIPFRGNQPHTTLHTTDISWLVQRLQRLTRRGPRR
jgi:hypothetical protein